MPKSIDQIMQDLRVEVHKDVVVSQEDGEQDSEVVSLGQLRQRQVVNSHLPIGWPTMPRNVLHRVAAYAKKITRRLLRWYINPIVDQQNRFNDAVVTTIADHSKVWGPFEQRIDDLEAKVVELTVAVEQLERALASALRLGEDRTGLAEQQGIKSRGS